MIVSHRRFGLAACALGLSIAACGGGSPPARGFGSRQLLETRDPTIHFIENNFGGSIVYFRTGGEIAANGARVFRIDGATGRIDEIDVNAPQAPAGGAPRFVCGSGSFENQMDLTVTDTETGQMVTIENVASGSGFSCPSRVDEIVFVWRVDAGGGITLWTGPFDRLAPAALGLGVRQVASSDDARFVVVAARADAPKALGLFSIDKATFAIGELVAPAIGAAAYADGATAGPPLASDSLGTSVWAYGLGDHFLYSRVMGDGTTWVFVGPLDAGPARELALFATPPDSPLISILMTERSGPVWVEYGAAGDLIRTWDDGPRRLVSCAVPHAIMAGMATSDRRRLLFYAQNFDPSFAFTAPLLLVSLDRATTGAACSLLAEGDVAWAGFSPGGTAMYWVEVPPDGDMTLWTADGEGGGRRQIGAAPSIDRVRFLDETRLEFRIKKDLVWLDISDGAGRLHFIVEHPFGRRIDLREPWLVTGYGFNAQDGTGTLGLVDRSTGSKRPISPAVAAYESAFVPGADGGDDGTRAIVYLVRGRNPSPQDGIWMATIGPSDLE